MGVTKLILSKKLKAKIKGVLAVHIVVMVTYCAININSNIPRNFYHDITINQYRVVIMTHQNQKNVLEKCWKLFWTTIKFCNNSYDVHKLFLSTY